MRGVLREKKGRATYLIGGLNEGTEQLAGDGEMGRWLTSS